MIDYTRANRLTYLWMGWPLIADRDEEIGARYRRERRGFSAQYATAMHAAVSEVSRILRPGGYSAVVIGTSRKFPDGATAVLDMFKDALDVVWGPTRRIPSRRRVSERLGTETSEWLCVYRKP